MSVRIDEPTPAATYCGHLQRQHKCYRTPGHAGPHTCLRLCGHTWHNPTPTPKDTP